MFDLPQGTDKFEESIVQFVVENPNCRISQIAKGLNRPMGTVYYRVYCLARKGVLTLDESRRGAVRASLAGGIANG